MMVAQIRDRGAGPFDAIAVRRSDVRHRTREHRGVADGERLVEHINEADVAGEVLAVDWEVRRTHELRERLADRETVVGRSVDRQRRSLAVDGHEEGQALHMIPVQVRDECMSDDRTRRWVHRLAPIAETGTEIEHDRRFARDFECDTRGVAAVPLVGWACTRRRAADAVERDLEHRIPS